MTMNFKDFISLLDKREMISLKAFDGSVNSINIGVWRADDVLNAIDEKYANYNVLLVMPLAAKNNIMLRIYIDRPCENESDEI